MRRPITFIGATMSEISSAFPIDVPNYAGMENSTAPAPDTQAEALPKSQPATPDKLIADMQAAMGHPCSAKKGPAADRKSTAIKRPASAKGGQSKTKYAKVVADEKEKPLTQALKEIDSPFDVLIGNLQTCYLQVAGHRIPKHLFLK